MDEDPYKPPKTPSDGERILPSANAGDGALAEPVLAYTASDNLEAHSLVTWLQSNGVRSYAVEDNSVVGLFAFGIISQVHKPQVFVNKPDRERADELLHKFESQRDGRRADLNDAPPITSKCDECGASSEFPASQDGTTQDCPKCHSYMNVGTFDWPDDFDFGDAESEPLRPDNVDDAIDAASKLDKLGDWHAAIDAYRGIADRWPEHATYVANCIADVKRKLDATR